MRDFNRACHGFHALYIVVKLIKFCTFCFVVLFVLLVFCAYKRVNEILRLNYNLPVSFEIMVACSHDA